MFMEDIRQTKEWAEYLESMGWKAEKSWSGVLAYVKQFPLIPLSVIKVQRTTLQQIDWAWLKSLEKKYRAVKLYVELNEPSERERKVDREFAERGLKKHAGPMLPSSTLVLNLKKTEAERLALMKAKTRYNLKLAERNNLQVKIINGNNFRDQADQWQTLIELIVASSRERRLWEISHKRLHNLIKAFGRNIYGIKIQDSRFKNKTQQNKLLAGALFLMTTDAVFYSYSGSTDDGKRMMAPTLCIWEGIKAGSLFGKKWFDFDGLDDPRFPKKAWQGFSTFKRGFGGKVVKFVPMYSQWLTIW